MTPENGTNFNPNRDLKSGQFTVGLDQEQPGDAALSRKVDPVLSPSREMGFQLNQMMEKATAVQVREDLQTTLRNLRKINPSIARLEISDSGEGWSYFAGAWDEAGEDITVSDWLQNGTMSEIEEVCDDGGDEFPTSQRPFDSEGSPMSTIATANDEHLAWDVDVDKALAVNPANPEATTLIDRLGAITWASRSLEAALEQVHISEGHSFIDAIETLSLSLPESVKGIEISELDGDDCGPSAQFIDAEGKWTKVEGDAADEILAMASNIKCGLCSLSARGTFDADWESGVTDLRIDFHR
jgi:hypothetical protein